MDYLLSKLLPLLIYPLGLGLISLAIGTIVAWRQRLWKTALVMTGGFMVLWIAALPVVSNTLIASLEVDYPPLAMADIPHAEAMIVLGGGIGGIDRDSGFIAMGDPVERLVLAWQLYRSGKAPRLVLVGGSARSPTPESSWMAGFLLVMGVPETALLYEQDSLNTRQNAANTRELLERERIGRVLLVTSAFHMRRALPVFRKAGIEAHPVPTDYRAVVREPSVRDWFPDAGALEGTTFALKEYLGWWIYRWRGWV